MTRLWLTRLSVATMLVSGCASHDAGSGQDGGPASAPPSCNGRGPGVSACGPAGGNCCASLVVPGGSFDRSYDGISTNGASQAYAATVSAFSLDKYEVTVGRFRAFVAAEVGGWRPGAGAGKHAGLPKGGLDDGEESGWNASWTAGLATTESAWSTNLACAPRYTTWTAAAGADDDEPINCVNWYEAYAFCIWDGGYLPSEAEWNYAAAGGREQRLYPWSVAYPPGSTTLDCEHANYSLSGPGEACARAGAGKVGGDSPFGDGKWGQSDLAGNVFEWNLDTYVDPYATTTCHDCANLSASPNALKVIRGGGFDGKSVCLLNSLRESSVPEGRSDATGVRCARTP